MKKTYVFGCLALMMSLSLYCSEEVFLGAGDPTLQDYDPIFLVQNNSDHNCTVRVHPFSDKFFFAPSFEEQAVINLVAGQLGEFTVPQKADGMVVKLCAVDIDKIVAIEEFKFLNIKEGNKKGKRYNYGLVTIQGDRRFDMRIVPSFFQEGLAYWKTLRVVDIWEF